MNGKIVTQLLHSRGMALWVSLMAVILLAVTRAYDPEPIPVSPLPSTGAIASVIGFVLLLLTAALLHFTNKRFNMLRSDTLLPVTLFMSMSVAIPYLDVTLSVNNTIAPVTMCCAFLLFTTYGDTSPQRRIFLIMTILSAMAMITVTFVYLVPVFILGCMQMRTFNLRTILAIFMGLVTPWWIAIGSGLMSISDIEWPRLSAVTIDGVSWPVITLLSTSAFTIISGIIFTSANIMKVYSYNSRARAFNGFFTLLLLATVLLTIIDFNNLTRYLSLLMAMTSYQASHYFVIHRSAPRGWIVIVTFMAIYWITFIWYSWIMPST